MPDNKLGLNWSAVEKALGEGTFSGYKIGILETEKLLKEMLGQKQIPGKKTERQLKYVGRFLSLPDKLEYSRDICRRILDEPHFEISREETKQIVMGYWQAMLDIEEAVGALSLWEKMSLRLKYFLAILIDNFKIAGWGIIVLSASIWFLGESESGLAVARFIVNINHFFIFKLLFWTIVVVAAAALIGGFIFLIGRGKKRF